MIYKSQHKNALCLLSLNLDFNQLRFICSMRNNYDLYVVVQDKILISKVNSKLTRMMSIISPCEKKCESLGYNGSTYCESGIIDFSTRDRSLYFFSEEMTEYENVWMVEEDVFIPSSETLLKIDAKYPSEDLLCPKIKRLHPDWHWYKNALEELPDQEVYTSMSCSIRCSNNFFKALKISANNKKYLEMDEILFANIALKNNLRAKYIEELKYIMFFNHQLPRNCFDGSFIDKNNLYHPLKNLNQQYNLRSLIN